MSGNAGAAAMRYRIPAKRAGPKQREASIKQNSPDDDASLKHRLILGTDVGGTFTDVLAVHPTQARIVAVCKIPSTPSNPAEAALVGMDRLVAAGMPAPDAVLHGSTVGTNALIEKRGGRTALLTTAGFTDVLALRRQARPRLYDLHPRLSRPLVPPKWRFGVVERMRADGTVEVGLTPLEVERVVAALVDARVESVAICLLHAYANDRHEQLLGDAVRARLPDVFVTLSSEVNRAFREYERTSTTVVNAYIGPPVAAYVRSFGAHLAKRSVPSLSIVKSNGGVTSSVNAARFPVHLIESGPAAGVMAAATLGAAERCPHLIAFDMGGTTAKVGVVQDGAPRIANAFDADRFIDGVDVGGYAVSSPVVELIEIGAGGGSIAHLDVANVLKVGPQSAGAAPGPAAYGLGGMRPTVTDAHVSLGHIAADGFGSDDLRIDTSAARRVIREHVADPLGWPVERAAAGMLTLATANMAEMVRLATLRRGLDPREFALVAFGGAGPLHAAEIAREVGVREVLIPPLPGLFSAIGTVLGDARHDLVQSIMTPVSALGGMEFRARIDALRANASILIEAENVALDAWRFSYLADLRFVGQLFEVTLPLGGAEATDLEGLAPAFRATYFERYGYDLPDHDVELVNLRLVASAAICAGGWPTVAPDAVSAPTGAAGPRRREVSDADGKTTPLDVWHREQLVTGTDYAGPLIVEDYGATIRCLDGQTIRVRPTGVLQITEHAG
ncbi:MAG: hydantoinase/oxoprolinase family protein [Pseudomonadota bacterium]